MRRSTQKMVDDRFKEISRQLQTIFNHMMNEKEPLPNPRKALMEKARDTLDRATATADPAEMAELHKIAETYARLAEKAEWDTDGAIWCL